MSKPRHGRFSEAEAMCAPFAVLRSAGVSINTVQRYFDNRLEGPLLRARDSDRVMNKLGPLIEDDLHEVAKGVDDDKFRHKVIELRRCIHNRRSISALKWAMVCEAIESIMPTAGEALRQWSDAQDAFEAAVSDMSEADNWLDSDIFARSLVALWENENFALGISHSNPGLFHICEKIRDGKIKAGRRSRFVNTVLSYLIRSGTKTSPITTFMQCTMLSIDEDLAHSEIDFDDARLAAMSSLNRGFYAEILDQARSRDLPEQSPLMINPSFRVEGNEAIAWRSTNQRRDGRIWQSERLQRLRLGQTLISALEIAPRPMSAIGWQQRLAEGGVKAERSGEAVRRLIEMGVLVRPGYDDPIRTALASQTSALLELTVASPNLGTDLQAIERDADNFATLPTSERIAAARSIEQRCTQLMTQVAKSDAPLELSGLVFENSWWRNVRGHLGGDFETVVQRALRTVANKLTISAEYCWLRDRFLERFGPGGRCDDVLAFLSQAAAAFPPEGLARGSYLDAASDLDLAGYVVPISFHLQIVGNGLEAMSDEEPAIVVNAVYPRGVWQLSRYTVFDESDTLIAQSHDWLRSCSGDEEPVAIVFGAAGVTLQNHGRLTERMIDLSRPASNADWLAGDDLVLAHDENNGRLVCEDRSGRRLRPFYLGGALPAIHFGPTYFLNMVGEPISLRPPPARMVLSQQSQTDMLRHQPRVTEGGCILLRATWWIKSRHLADELGEGEFGNIAFRLHRYFEREGIPLENFMAGQTQDLWHVYSGATERYRKPMWCDLRNAWSVRRLIRIMETMDYIVIREALPGLDGAMVKIKGQPHASEFHIEAAFRLPSIARVG